MAFIGATVNSYWLWWNSSMASSTECGCSWGCIHWSCSMWVAIIKGAFACEEMNDHRYSNRFERRCSRIDIRNHVIKCSIGIRNWSPHLSKIRNHISWLWYAQSSFELIPSTLSVLRPHSMVRDYHIIIYFITIRNDDLGNSDPPTSTYPRLYQSCRPCQHLSRGGVNIIIGSLVMLPGKFRILHCTRTQSVILASFRGGWWSCWSMIAFSPNSDALGGATLITQNHFEVVMHFVYFSITTMTSTGYGDIAPIRWYTEVLAVIQMLSEHHNWPQSINC